MDTLLPVGSIHSLLNRAGSKLVSRVPLPVRNQLASFLRRGVPWPWTQHALFSPQNLPGTRPTPISQPASFLSFHLESFLGRLSPRFRNLQAFSLFISNASRGASYPDIATSKLSFFSRHLRQKLNRPKGPVQKLSIFCQMFCEMF